MPAPHHSVYYSVKALKARNRDNNCMSNVFYMFHPDEKYFDGPNPHIFIAASMT